MKRMILRHTSIPWSLDDVRKIVWASAVTQLPRNPHMEALAFYILDTFMAVPAMALLRSSLSMTSPSYFSAHERISMRAGQLAMK